MSELAHVMVDLETMGTVPGCVVLSIGAVRFDPRAGTLHDEFYCVVNRESSLERYLREDADTAAWWAKQSEQAREVLAHADDLDMSVPLPDAMHSLNVFFKGVGTSSRIRVYGNGADFDNPILRVMYDAADVKPYAGPWGGRCYRTLKNLDELLGEAYKAPPLERGGTYHNALDDAKTQARHLCDIVALIRGGEK